MTFGGATRPDYVSIRSLALVLAASVLTGGCSAAGVPSASPESSLTGLASGSPSSSATAPRETAQPAATPATSPSTSPLPGPSPSAAPPRGNEPVEWVLLPPSPSLQNARVEGATALAGGIAAVGCLGSSECEGPALWLTDAGGWGPRVDLPVAVGESGGEAVTAVAGAAGMVVGGSTRQGDDPHAALWFSSDARTFTRVAGDGSFRRAVVLAVAVHRERFVAVGSEAYTELFGFRAWSSDDGTSWTAAAPPDDGVALPERLVVEDGRLHAFGASCGVCLAETNWWWSDDGSSWTAEGVAPGLRNVYLSAVIATESGLTGAGSTLGATGEMDLGIWQRPRGEDRWSRVEGPDLPSEARIAGLASVAGGVVAIASRPVGQSSTALLLAASPGTDRWALIAELPDTWPVALVPHSTDARGLVVVGRSGANGEGPVVTWVGAVPWSP